MSETRFGGLPLQFGIFDWIEWDQTPASDIFEQRLQMLEYADQAGFYCYHLAEHHVTPLSLANGRGACVWDRWSISCPSTTRCACSTKSACWTI